MKRILVHIDACLFPETPLRAWTQTALFTLFIYVTLGPARWLAERLKTHNALTPTIILSLLCFLAILLYIIYKRIPLSWQNLCLIVATSIAYILCMKYLARFPEEKIHFVEYGLLAHFIYQALLLHTKKKVPIFLLALTSIALLGYIDEVIQYFLPNRVYDLRDVGINIVAGTLIVLLRIGVKNSVQRLA